MSFFLLHKCARATYKRSKKKISTKLFMETRKKFKPKQFVEKICVFFFPYVFLIKFLSVSEFPLCAHWLCLEMFFCCFDATVCCYVCICVYVSTAAVVVDAILMKRKLNKITILCKLNWYVNYFIIEIELFMVR